MPDSPRRDGDAMTAVMPMPLAVAPMMAWTDRHCRYLFRRITRHTQLYTEMVTANAVLHGDRDRLLGFHPEEHPVALQLGGADPASLAECAQIAAEYGYDEVNLNVGCPSDRVQSGRFGACLMAEPETVAACVAAMRAAAPLPISVKSRIAIDEQEEWPALSHFVETVSAAGCSRFIVHARKAWLEGLSPEQNRTVPPLRHELVHRLKAEYPHLDIIINGGIEDLDAAAAHLHHVDGAMIGRAAYRDPYILAEADHRFFGGDRQISSRAEVVAAMLPYIETQIGRGWRLHAVTRHMISLFQGVPGARQWRRILSTEVHAEGAGPEVVERALAAVAAGDSARA
ncbi:MAG: tRNA dihydrouridine(20/20a) synthase DusA, partial [Rhodospirillaceae bacterium]|nr:tRNA dihydrouridine(20/20a) synthase DusA [Rhodospirillaceae bacterium]